MIGQRGIGQATDVINLVSQPQVFKRSVTCNPATDTNCPTHCYWALTDDCDTNLAFRTAHGGGLPWYCDLPGSSYVATASCIPSPPVVPPAAPQTQEQMTVYGAWTPDQAIAATDAAQKQSNIDFFNALGSQGAYQPVNCSSALTALTSPTCWAQGLQLPGLPNINIPGWVLPALLIGGGVLLVTSVGRRR